MEYYSPDTEFIMKYIKELKLPTVKDSLDDIITDAVAGHGTIGSSSESSSKERSSNALRIGNMAA